MTDFEDVVAAYGLRPDELERLHRIDAVLCETNVHTNLISRSTTAHRVVRHYADSLQLWPHLPESARTLLDIGSGGGFPALPLAVMAAERRPDLALTLCESVRKKASFLEQAADAADLSNVTVRNVRAEALTDRFEVVTARAVASLDKLLALAVPLLRPGGTLIAPKGRRASEELDEAKKTWRMTAKRVKSKTDPDAVVLILTDMERRS